MKKKWFAIVCVLCAAMMLFAGVCAAKGKKVDPTLQHIQQANIYCDKYVCRYDAQANVYTFVPRDEVLARLSGKAATMIPSVAYAAKDGAVLYRLLFSYAGLEYLDMSDVTIVDADGRQMSFTVPDGATTKEQQAGYVTEDYAAGFEGDVLDELYKLATAPEAAAPAPAEDGGTAEEAAADDAAPQLLPGTLRLTGKGGEASRQLTAYDKSVLKESIDIYRALQK